MKPGQYCRSGVDVDQMGVGPTLPLIAEGTEGNTPRPGRCIGTDEIQEGWIREAKNKNLRRQQYTPHDQIKHHEYMQYTLHRY